MKCKYCGGYVEWMGPLTNLTHTECIGCGAANCHEPEEPDQEENPVVGMESDTVYLIKNPFLLFIGDAVDPRGGWRDFAGMYPTLEAAKEEAINRKMDMGENWGETCDFVFWQIVDIRTGQIVEYS